MNRKYIIPALLVICSSGAFAQTTSPNFDDVDSNNDGMLSQAELTTAGLNTSLANADTDKDGTLSRSEYEAGMRNSN